MCRRTGTGGRQGNEAALRVRISARPQGSVTVAHSTNAAATLQDSSHDAEGNAHRPAERRNAVQQCACVLRGWCELMSRRHNWLSDSGRGRRLRRSGSGSRPPRGQHADTELEQLSTCSGCSAAACACVTTSRHRCDAAAATAAVPLRASHSDRRCAAHQPSAPPPSPRASGPTASSR